MSKSEITICVFSVPLTTLQVFLKWVYFLLVPTALVLGLPLIILHLEAITAFLMFLLVPTLPSSDYTVLQEGAFFLFSA